jgi:hypothetical protein
VQVRPDTRRRERIDALREQRAHDPRQRQSPGAGSGEARVAPSTTNAVPSRRRRRWSGPSTSTTAPVCRASARARVDAVRARCVSHEGAVLHRRGA